MARQTKTPKQQSSKAAPANGSPFGPGSFGNIPNAQARAGRFQNSGGFRGKNTPANWRRFNP